MSRKRASGGFVLAFLAWLTVSARPATAGPVRDGWQEIPLVSARGRVYAASSELEKKDDPRVFGRYGPHNLFDGDPATCWAEGRPGSGVGEWVAFPLPDGTSALRIVNGYAKSPETFRNNGRVRRLSVSVLAALHLSGHSTESFDIYEARGFAKPFEAMLPDATGPIRIELPFDPEELQDFQEDTLRTYLAEHGLKDPGALRPITLARLEIRETHRGRRHDDTCISEIGLEPRTRVYTGAEDRALLMDSGSESGIVLDSDADAVFQVLETSRDGAWTIAIKMPAETEGSRTETEYILYSTALRRRIAPGRIAERVGAMTGFSGNGTAVYLEFLDAQTLEGKRADLSRLLKTLRPEER